MNRTLLFFANIDTGRITSTVRQYLHSPWLTEVFIVSAALLGAMLIAGAWAFFYWKKSRRTHLRRHDLPDRTSMRAERRGRKRRRRSSNSMNPTLAETGGLPPVRGTNPQSSPTF